MSICGLPDKSHPNDIVSQLFEGQVVNLVCSQSLNFCVCPSLQFIFYDLKASLCFHHKIIIKQHGTQHNTVILSCWITLCVCAVMLKTKCLACDNVSRTYESFTDLSLDFPKQYHATNDDMSSACTDTCNLTGQWTVTALQALLRGAWICPNCPVITVFFCYSLFSLCSGFL